MKKFLTKILTALLLISAIPLPTTSAEFLDIYKLHKNYEAILYLQENNIIEGYSDGTFRPENKVNRAEFLKIILEGSDIALDVQENTPFPDVNHSAWYAPYVKKAYKEGWIVGYPDGTFKPEQTINKVEALKILGEVQKWELPSTISFNPYTDTPKTEWYAKYLVYAKTHNYLEETGSTFSPDSLMTRGNISEVIYRTLTVDEYTHLEEPPQEPSDEQYIDFTPVNPLSIPNNFFDGILLDDPLPNTFYKNEVYVLKGQATSNNAAVASVYLDPLSTSTPDYETILTDLDNNYFEIPVYFDEVGNFDLGILPNESGETKILTISVLPELPSSTNQENLSEKAESLNVDFKNDQTFVEFEAPANTLKILTLTQNNNKVSYISRQDTNKIAVNYKDFRYFTEGTVSYSIETAKINSTSPLHISSNYTSTKSKSFEAVEHTFDNIIKENVTANPPDLLSSDQSITFSGIAISDIRTYAYIIKPDGFVDEVTLTTTSPEGTYYDHPIILGGGTFRFSYNPTNTGRYIVEVIDKEGLPVINHPVYIGGIIPLIPDFEDLNEREFFTGTLNIDSLRQELLQEINKSRKKHGLAEISLSEELNDLAQAHSNDMAENNFFAHVNLQGETPEDRRIEAGIPTPVAENIARDTGIIFAHLGLMRSAIHRDNILEGEWTRVGIGIALDDGYLIISEEFSTSEITGQDLENYKNQLFSEINKKRNQNNKSSLIYNNNLESACVYLNNKVINEGTTLSNSIFEDSLDSYNITGTSQAIGRIYNIWSDILSSILEEETSLIQDNWEKIGIDIQIDNKGNNNTILIINRS